MTKTGTYEEWAKGLFTKEPASMRLLVVVDKLLHRDQLNELPVRHEKWAY
jgi:hypothetical protein